MLNKRKRRILFYLFVTIFLILLAPILLYSMGYAINRNFEIQKTGGIFIQSSEFGASMRADGKSKNTSLIGRSAILKNLLPGNYTVSVEKKGFRKWEKILSVEPESVTSRSVLLVPLDIPGKLIGTSSPQKIENMPNYPSMSKYWALQDGIFLILGEDRQFYKNIDPFDALASWGATALEILQSKKKSFFDDKDNRIIFWDDSGIDSYWVGELSLMPNWEVALKKNLDIADRDARYLHIFSSLSPIRSVTAYPGWSEYIIAAFSNGVFAVELDFFGGQNIISSELKKLLIKDEEHFIELQIP
jgi:hypothetical protein